MSKRTQVFVVMGVSGSGKSTLAKLFADKLGLPFIDGDNLHPQTNIDKMASGQPLNDEDRAPWLTIINQQIARWERSEGGVIVCSALKQRYRQHLSSNTSPQFLFLDVPEQEILQRVTQRQGHFMKAEMVRSQFEALERPDNEENCSVIDARLSIEQTLKQVLTQAAR